MSKTKRHSLEIRTFASSLRDLRKARKVSLQIISGRAGVSKSLVSKIERNEVQPSLNVAVKLASALDTTLPEMLRYDHYDRIVKLAKAEQGVIRNRKQGWERLILSPSFHGARVEISRLTLNSRTSLGSFPPHPKGSEEYIYVLQGALRVKVNGSAIQLDEGDCLFFEADRMHTVENFGSKKAIFFVTIRH